MTSHAANSDRPANLDNAPTVRILALDVLISLRETLPAGQIIAADYATLNADLLTRTLPDHVLLPLVSPNHDATTVIERLQSLNYIGLITVLAPPLPDARMVERELRALGPGARLTLVTSRDCPS